MVRSKVVYLAEVAERERDSVLLRAIREHKTALRRFLRMRLANEQDREEIIQEVYLRLCKQENLPQKLAFGPERTRSYLFSIATNLICDMRRRAQSRRANDHESFDESVYFDERATTEDRLQQRQEIALVKQCILKLNPKCRQAFVLSRFSDMSYRDIAGKMGVSCSMVEKYISQALAELRCYVGRS